MDDRDRSGEPHEAISYWDAHDESQAFIYGQLIYVNFLFTVLLPVCKDRPHIYLLLCLSIALPLDEFVRKCGEWLILLEG